MTLTVEATGSPDKIEAMLAAARHPRDRRVRPHRPDRARARFERHLGTTAPPSERRRGEDTGHGVRS